MPKIPGILYPEVLRFILKKTGSRELKRRLVTSLTEKPRWLDSVLKPVVSFTEIESFEVSVSSGLLLRGLPVKNVTSSFLLVWFFLTLILRRRLT